MNQKQYLTALHDWWAYTLVEACHTLTAVFSNPSQSRRNMNRLRRHADAQLQETFRLAENQVYQLVGGQK